MKSSTISVSRVRQSRNICTITFHFFRFCDKMNRESMTWYDNEKIHTEHIESDATVTHIAEYKSYIVKPMFRWFRIFVSFLSRSYCVMRHWEEVVIYESIIINNMCILLFFPCYWLGYFMDQVVFCCWYKLIKSAKIHTHTHIHSTTEQFE